MTKIFYRLSLIKLLISILLLVACKAEDLDPECNDLSKDGPRQATYLIPKYMYSYPIQANNTKGLVYIRKTSQDSISSFKEILYFNENTGNVRTVYTSRSINSLDLSKKDLIAFVNFDWNIYQIKTNGDSLKKISIGRGFKPSWSPDGTKLAYYDWDHQVNLKENNSPPRVIEGVYSTSKVLWDSDSSFVVLGFFAEKVSQFLFRYNLNTATIDTISINQLDISELEGCFSKPLGKIYHYTSSKDLKPPYKLRLYETNLKNGNTLPVSIFCASDLRGNPSISVDGLNMYSIRAHSEKVGFDSIYTETSIIKMNLTTLEETFVYLP